MKILIAAFAAVVITTGGASAQVSSGPAVPVYDSTEISFDSYVVLHRMGVQDWKSAFGLGGYDDEASARQALLTDAAKLNADGVINLHCLSQTDRFFNPAGYYCYGNAIKLKNERRAVGR